MVSLNNCPAGMGVGPFFSPSLSVGPLMFCIGNMSRHEDKFRHID